MHEEIIAANQAAWSTLSKDHYEHFRELLKDEHFTLNPLVIEGLGSVEGKRILHLQCNTGADSILLARMGATVTGVDLSPSNIHYATLLAQDFGMDSVQFIQSDVLKLREVHDGTYDIVLTSDGAIGWLPDLKIWGQVIAHFLKHDGIFFLHDSHPFMMIFDEEELAKGTLSPKYPYFDTEPEYDTTIGGYASKAKTAENYFFGHTLSAILQGLIQAGLHLTDFREYDRCVPGMGGSRLDERGLCYYPELEGKLPLVMSLKAKKLPGLK
ncbi:methyltransferase domain-containing protein [Proteiniclasticum sp. SCR006]|uniref:Methyltransferase domain-containing protein n=1 Tax=Proteiniclasticum aestuarii TaxID=2817862 RepID=A0A939KJ58_9CLOT|nr:methyltransferase domain-containing protein [Proteiniclasticum aestuarii]MBO1264838.1 methyltransferase domain-containing protein [Proteiniclasticum aestuarii]